MRISDWSSDVCSSDLALIIRYNPGAGIGWHKDRLVFEHVIGISLGAPASLRLRRRVDGKFERARAPLAPRSEEHTSELQSLMRTSYAVFCLKKKNSNSAVSYSTHTLPHTTTALQY